MFFFFCEPKWLQKQCLEPLTKSRNERLNTAGNYNYIINHQPHSDWDIVVACGSPVAKYTDGLWN